MARHLSPELERWAVEQALAGQDPGVVLQALYADGWNEQEAIDAVEEAVRGYLLEQARESGSPPPARVPAAFELNGAAVLDAGDRRVQVLAQMLLPRVVVLGGLLSDEECDALVGLSRSRLSRSTTVDPETGEGLVHAHRTSRGTCFARGENALCARIEARIARLLDWPLDHGEGLQILHYGTGAEYRPHYDYFDPQRAGSEAVARCGGQRVATLVMYLNTPARGGATVFPDARFEAAAVKGNAVFFSYDRPHPMTRSLHAGAPVLEGEKWIATKWLRERAYP
ncbi:2OG-Fe(II) oxygenase [Stenotrophomonas sp. MMGLT7]|uniref:2OG-Fe(II) oxygenase n=1 Tax=Stenotrophomonas sp. MMGLT7 TaxID=2901227 RepID=UPI001E2A4EFF|nr:2OG-Fe(II) oxygenase [Stenotrophomonas sp. MMGLT7]MCD7098938.1 2OG-Fe(II) oxygenase [Stenotrophomonas sp. MMGLT7]